MQGERKPSIRLVFVEVVSNPALVGKGLQLFEWLKHLFSDVVKCSCSEPLIRGTAERLAHRGSTGSKGCMNCGHRLPFLLLGRGNVGDSYYFTCDFALRGREQEVPRKWFMTETSSFK